MACAGLNVFTRPWPVGLLAQAELLARPTRVHCAEFFQIHFGGELVDPRNLGSWSRGERWVRNV